MGAPGQVIGGGHGDFNPLGATVAVGQGDVNAALGAQGFGAPPGADPYGAPPAADPYAVNPPGGSNPGFGAPAQGFGAPPPGYGAPPPAYGGGPQPGDPYAAGQQQGGFGASPPQGAPQQDFNQQFSQGAAQAGAAFGQAANEMGGALQQGLGYQGGAPMMQGQQPGMMQQGPGKPKMMVLLLAILPSAFGFCGIHRFFTGHIGIGIAQFLTVGGCGIWQLIDIVQILTGKFTDKDGNPLVG
jgi:TM2 domain-containing membrane protein YozV